MKAFVGFLIFQAALTIAGCKPPNASSLSEADAGVDRRAVTSIRVHAAKPLMLRQFSSKSLRAGLECKIEIQSPGEVLEVVPTPKYRVTAGTSGDFFITLNAPVDEQNCNGVDPGFDYRNFFVSSREVELILGGADLADAAAPFDPSDISSRRAELLARNIEQRRSGGGKPCGLTSFGSRGCWACVGWSMTDVGLFPSGLGAAADHSPNGFLRATAQLRRRKSADGTLSINGVRFRSLMTEFGMRPSLAPRGSILFCNTSAEGHAAIITKPANEMRSDVVEVLGSSWRQSLCWSKVDEILFPLD